MSAFLLALLASVAVSALPGPLGALCARSGARDGLGAGLRLGAAIALGQLVHAGLASYAAFDLERVPERARRALAAALAVLFLALALRAWRAAPEPSRPRERRGRGAFAAVFLLSLATPGTLPGYLLAFSVLDLRGGEARPAVLCGALAGSLLWWSAIAALGHRFRGRLEESPRVVARVVGALFLLGALGALRAALA